MKVFVKIGVLEDVGVFVTPEVGVFVGVNVLVVVGVFVRVGVVVNVGVGVRVEVAVAETGMLFKRGKNKPTVCPFFEKVVLLLFISKLIVQPANLVSFMLGRITKCRCGAGCSFPVHTCTVILSAITASF